MKKVNTLITAAVFLAWPKALYTKSMIMLKITENDKSEPPSPVTLQLLSPSSTSSSPDPFPLLHL
jgi:hypothetical protein